jgi:hypothetical protein
MVIIDNLWELQKYLERCANNTSRGMSDRIACHADTKLVLVPRKFAVRPCKISIHGPQAHISTSGPDAYAFNRHTPIIELACTSAMRPWLA